MKKIHHDYIDEFVICYTQQMGRVGQAFCNVFGVSDSALFYEEDPNKAWSIINDNYTQLLDMKEIPLTSKQISEIYGKLTQKGWIPVGLFGSMIFRKNGKRYDLSAANLDILDYIEEHGCFLLD